MYSGCVWNMDAFLKVFPACLNRLYRVVLPCKGDGSATWLGWLPGGTVLTSQRCFPIDLL
jgi:hypothetical protein